MAELTNRHELSSLSQFRVNYDHKKGLYLQHFIFFVTYAWVQ